MLLEAGASKEAANFLGYTPLHLAAESGHKEILEMLLAAGASKEAVTKKGYTPLHRAAKYGHKEVLEVLLMAGASKDARTTSGLTALELAALHGTEADFNSALSKFKRRASLRARLVLFWLSCRFSGESAGWRARGRRVLTMASE